MPVKVKGPDGNDYQFPDGTDKDGAVAYFQRKGILGQPSIPAPPNPILAQNPGDTVPNPGSTGILALGAAAKGAAAEAGRQAFKTAKAMGDVTGPISIGMPIGPTELPEENPLKSMVTQPFHAFKDSADGNGLVDFASSAAGGNPADSREYERSANLETDPVKQADLYGRSLGAKFGLPLVGAAVAHAVAPKTPVPVTATTDSVNNMLKIVNEAKLRVSPEAAPAAAAEIQQLWQQTAQERHGYTDASLNSTLAERGTGTNSDLVGPVRRGNAAALRIANDAVDVAAQPTDTVMKVYGKLDARSAKAQISAELTKQMNATADPGVKASLAHLQQQVLDATNFSDLNEIKKHANKEATALFNGSPGQQINSAAQTVYAYKLAGDAIRDLMYPVLEREARLPAGSLRQFGRREGLAIQARDGLYDYYYKQAAPQEVSRQVEGYLGYVFGGEDMRGSISNRKIAGRALSRMPIAPGKSLLPGPTGEFNSTVRKAIGPLGEGAAPERVTVTPGQLLLPGPGETYTAPKFTLPTGLPQEIVQQPTVATRKTFAGTKSVPNPSYSPLEQPDLPHTYHVGGTDAAQQRASVGAQAEATPDHSFTGPKEVPETQWQLSQETTAPGSVTRGGGGMLITSDPAIAQQTLQSMRDYLRRLGKVGEPNHMQRIRDLADQLQQQLDAYKKYQAAQARPAVPSSSVTVTPAQPGKVVPKNALKRYGAAAVAGRTAQTAVPPPPPPPEE